MDGMRWLDDGEFTMGSLDFYPEEAPLARVRVKGFWIDETPVTNRQFAAFVAATNHVTLAEVAPDPKLYPGILPGMDRAGSLVFRKSPVPIGTDDPSQWWGFAFGADWRHPTGPAPPPPGTRQPSSTRTCWAGKDSRTRISASRAEGISSAWSRRIRACAWAT